MRENESSSHTIPVVLQSESKELFAHSNSLSMVSLCARTVGEAMAHAARRHVKNEITISKLNKN